MIKIKLEQYKENKQYLLLFDILIKQVANNKDIFLEDLNITPSSYRRAKQTEQVIGDNIVHILCDYFDIKKPSVLEIDKYEMFINKIYYEYYYNLNNNSIYILGKLDELINENNLMYPIFLLFKLLFTLINDNNQSIIINENEYLYEQVIKYKSFYNDELQDVLNHVEILFDKEFQNKKIYLDNKNGITYSVVSSKYLQANKYIESLYYAQKAKEIFINDENYKRVAYINFNIMSCYCNLNNFEKYYNLAHTQYFSLSSFNDYSDARDLSAKHYAISLVANKYYQEIEYFFKNKTDVTFTEVVCLLIARFNLNKEEYQKYYTNVKEVLKDDERLETLEKIKNYLINNDKKQLKKIKEGIHKNLIYVLMQQ